MPLHAPEAVQEVAWVEDQVKVEPLPLVTLVGFALMETLGGVADTVTVADCDAEPPGPVHVSVYFEVVLRAEVDTEPLIGSVPLQPPEAVHDVALVEDQVSVDLAPLAIVLGFAVRVTAGGVWVIEMVADCVALPPLPVHVIP